MNREETKAILMIITRAYPRMKIVETKEDVDLWHECLCDLEYERARRAAISVVKRTMDFPPDIATIRNEYGKLLAEERQEEGRIKCFYEQARSYYPKSGEAGYGWKEFRGRVRDAMEAEQLQNLVIGYVRHLEKIGATEVMDFAECVRTVRKVNGEIVAGKENGK